MDSSLLFHFPVRPELPLSRSLETRYSCGGSSGGFANFPGSAGGKSLHLHSSLCFCRDNFFGFLRSGWAGRRFLFLGGNVGMPRSYTGVSLIM